jgi:hypothetical protein
MHLELLAIVMEAVGHDQVHGFGRQYESALGSEGYEVRSITLLDVGQIPMVVVHRSELWHTLWFSKGDAFHRRERLCHTILSSSQPILPLMQ